MSKLSRLRTAAFLRQNGLCYYCGLPMWLDTPAALALRLGITPKQAGLLECTAEHLLPKSEGGCDSAANIVAACLFCNNRRHAGRKEVRSPDQHREHVQSRMKKRRWHKLSVKPGEIHFLRQI